MRVTFGGGGIFMSHPKHFLAGLSVLPENQPDARISAEQSLRVRPEFVTVINARRRFVEVSPSFCKLLGYSEDELLGKLYDDFTVPGTNHIPITWQLFMKAGFLFGIWVFTHKSGTKLFVRFEAFARADGLYETHMELLAAGA